VPLYEYQCPKCGRFEVIRKFSDPPLKKCPTCGKTVQKLASAPAIQFKGAGWYVTDYAKKASGEGASKGEGGKADSGKTEGAKADATSSSAPSESSSSTSESSSAKPAKAKDTKALGGRSSK
jgi:putative FmdB family regulatory protein